MTPSTLLSACAHINGASFVGLDTYTEVPLTGGKKNPMQGRVTKRMTGAVVMSFQNKNTNAYAAMVERRLVAEGKDPADFVLAPRVWGTRVPNMPIVEHKGSTYLEVIFMHPGDTEYELDGQHIDKDLIIGLPVPTEGKQGGLTNKVVIRTFLAESITALRIDGKVYR